ncbi:MAG: ABC transporter ATP-binding protein [Oscillospiraceae bacterium]|nr:ABC transporter ATP-binding protein [Oscillospiraceae bacterium]
MIELRQATKRFDDKSALDCADLTIGEGTAFGLLGPNGAGKSTILRLLSGIYEADGGAVLIDGQPVFDAPQVKQRVFFINDETVQFGSFTLKGLKDYYKGFYPKFSDEVFDKLAEMVALPMNKRMDTFSKGMKRQAVVITGLASGTDYLLLDEAFDGLDPTMRIIVRRMLVDAMLDRKLTTVISSHNLNEINEVCDSVALIHQGKVVFSRDLDSVKGNVHKIQAAFASDPGEGAFKDERILHYSRNGSVHYIIVKGTEEEIQGMFAHLSPTLFDIIPMTLEEIFIYEMEGLGYDSSGLRQTAGAAGIVDAGAFDKGARA